MGRHEVWVFSPHRGGSRISASVQREVRARIQRHAEANYLGRFREIDVRFRGPFCYIDAHCEPDPPTRSMLKLLGETKEQYYERRRSVTTHLCRLRYFAGPESWSVAFYTYSHERYEPAAFPDGEWFGTPEAAFDLGALYL